MTEKSSTTTPLGAFLRDRRARMDPASFGFGGRRRTPGLRRDEVAQRANISPTWYTWREQGRGGAPGVPVFLEKAEESFPDIIDAVHVSFLAFAG